MISTLVATKSHQIASLNRKANSSLSQYPGDRIELTHTRIGRETKMKHGLEALLRRMSRIAEREFDEHGEIRDFSIWLTEARNGEQEILRIRIMDAPPPGPEFDSVKDRMVVLLQQIFAEKDIVRFAHAAECWMGSSLSCRASEDPRARKLSCSTPTMAMNIWWPCARLFGHNTANRISTSWSLVTQTCLSGGSRTYCQAGRKIGKGRHNDRPAAGPNRSFRIRVANSPEETGMAKQVRTFTREQLRKLSDEQLQALTDDEFWDAIEPEGVCPHCDPRLGAEAKRRNARWPQ
jgi:hypothetical protein